MEGNQKISGKYNQLVEKCKGPCIKYVHREGARKGDESKQKSTSVFGDLFLLLKCVQGGQSNM